MRANLRVEAAEAEIARREVILLEVQRVVGNVHLAIQAEQRAVGVDDDRRVVIHARRAALEERAHDHDTELARELREALAGRARDAARRGRTDRNSPRGRSIASGTAPARR